MEGFNNQQGPSNRDMEGDKGEVVATKAAAAEGVVDTYKMHMHTYQEVFPNTSPRWKDPTKSICRVLPMVALPRVSWGDKQPAEADAKPGVLKPLQNIQKLECVLFSWI